MKSIYIIGLVFLVSCEQRLFPKESVKVERGETINGKKIGAWIGLYGNGDTAYVGFYKDGLKDSVWREYYPNGILTSIENIQMV